MHKQPQTPSTTHSTSPHHSLITIPHLPHHIISSIYIPPFYHIPLFSHFSPSPPVLSSSKLTLLAEIVEEQLAPFQVYGESLHHLNWVEMTASARGADKKERDKLKKFEKRLIAVCTYRIFVIKKATFGGSRSVFLTLFC